ncbi:MAG: nucleoside monophosphate kinase [Patescibacteria group bacterium]
MVKDKKIYRIVFLGPQGSGKSTQAKILAQKLNIPIISTGEMYRHEAKKKTIFAEQVSGYINQGKLVPGEITNALVKKRLAKKDCAKGFVLDGYPRTIDQAIDLDEMTKITHVVLIDLADHEALYRISGREVCPKCEEVYHFKFKPPKVDNQCDRCNIKLVTRRDDDEDAALRKRLSIYREEIGPIIERYQNKKIIHEINGFRNIPQVEADVTKIFS